jgi:hypothetical protein
MQHAGNSKRIEVNRHLVVMTAVGAARQSQEGAYGEVNEYGHIETACEKRHEQTQRNIHNSRYAYNKSIFPVIYRRYTLTSISDISRKYFTNAPHQ